MKKIYSFLLLSSFFIYAHYTPGDFKYIKKIIIWGHKFNDHTHHWIHHAYHRAFKHLGFETYWFEDKPNINFDFSHSLFFVHGVQDRHLPLRADCRYILHNCTSKKYKPLFDIDNCVNLQVYTHDVLERDVQKIDDFIYLDFKEHVIYMPWATDLVPHEIDEIKDQLKKHPVKKKLAIHYVGSVWHPGNSEFENVTPINAFKRCCKEYGINFYVHARVPMKKNIELIQRSWLAPAIQSKWQCQKGYIPCRIFKNISYGQLGITNSETVYKLFKKKIVYNKNPYQLAKDALQRVRSVTSDEIFELMDFVRDNHTYINRINVLLTFLQDMKPL